MPIRVLALLAVCALASCWRVLTTFFGVDDFSYVRHTVLPWPGWVEVFALRYFGDHVAFAWHRNIVGLNPVWFHATLLATHLLNTWLVLTLLPKLGLRRWPDAAIAAFVFVLHPTTYTVMNWTALGFEELTVVTLTLVVLHLFVAYLERPRVWLLALAPVVMFIGCGFKNLAILVPAWLAAAGAVIIFEHRSANATVARAAIFILPTMLVTAWYTLVVSPRLPQFKHPAYEVDLSPLSMLRGFSVLMANLLNPLPVGRIGTMYQESVPAAIAQWGPEARVAFGAAIVAIVLAVWTIVCWRTRRLVFGAAMLMVILVGLGPYAMLPRHLLDYASWPLPAVAALWGMTIAEAYRYAKDRKHGGRLSALARDLLSRRPVRAAGALLLVSYAWVNGATLHGSNLFVRQARHAELVDGVVRRTPDGSRIVFVPPSELAYTDTVYAQSIQAMHPEKRLKVAYLPATGESSSAEAANGVVLLALDAVPDQSGDAPRLYAVERAQWAASSHVRIQRGRTLIQPFSTGAGRVREIHLMLDAFSDRCALQVDVVRAGRTATAAGTPAGTPARVAGGVMACRGAKSKVTGYRSLVLDQPLAPNTGYALHVTATPDAPPPDAIRCGPLSGGGATTGAWTPFSFDDEGAGSSLVLAMRLISESWR
jgi:hypothetical protein